jgi:DNA-directed RNA polymerase subunit K/omega
MTMAAVVVSENVLTTLTKYEFTRVKGFRLQQLANGAIPYVNLFEGGDDPHTSDEVVSLVEIFNREAYAGMLPYQIERDASTQTKVSCYKACIDIHGNLRTIQLRVKTLPPMPTDIVLEVQPSIRVTDLTKRIALMWKNEIKTLHVVDQPQQDQAPTLLETTPPTRRVWDYGIIDDGTIVVNLSE